jgi:methyl-accepting chemotaxis protein
VTAFDFGLNARSVLAAMNRSQAIIEFDLTGRILHANENFLQAVGYELSEVVGQHHRIFVDPAEAASPEYAAFWARLAEGHFDQRQYKRVAKGGREIWIEASYNPVIRGK